MKNPHKVFQCCVALAAFGGGLALASDISDPPPPVYQAPPPPAPPIVDQPVSPPPTPAKVPVAPRAVAPANPAPGAPLPPKRSAAELEKLVAPMALYPDPLVAAMLPAAAYPIEVVMAARFVKDTNNLTKINEQPWDDSVKTVARFPEVIQQMNDNVAWTVELGQAFVVQQKDVMDAVQSMRAKAQTAGTLTTTPEQVVVVTNVVVQQADASGVLYVTNQVVQILPGASEVIYVPHYDPAVVYWPPPYYYYDPFWPCVSFGFGLWWGSAYWGHCNWYGGWVAVGHPCPYPPYRYPPPPGPGHPPPGGGPVPPGGRPPPPGARPLPPGPAQPMNTTAQTAAARPWQPDANRLRSAGTRGSLATVKSRDPSTAQFASSGTSSRAVPGASVGTRPGSRSGIDGSPPVTTSPRASRSATSAGVAPSEASVSRTSPRTSASGASRSAPPGASTSRPSTSGGGRATTTPNYSRSAPRLSSPSQSSSFGRAAPPSYRGAAPSGGVSRGSGGSSFRSAGPVSRGGGGGSFSRAGSVSRGGGGGAAPSGGFSGRGGGGFSGGGFSGRGGGGFSGGRR